MFFHFRPLAMAATFAMVLAGCVEPSSGGSGREAVELGPKTVLIRNNTGRPIWRFYGSPVTINIWEEDILGTNILPARQSVNIDFTDGRDVCHYDMKAEFQDGSSIVKDNINVCSVSLVSFP